jgi:gliding motility-associated lipoprotein GldD
MRFPVPLPALACWLAALGLAACADAPVPKPRAYPRVHFPERGGFQRFGTEDCPFTFELPDYYMVERKDTYFEREVAEPCWGNNVHLPALNGTLYLTYKPLGPGQDLLTLTEQAYQLTYKHARKADYIEPLEINTEHDVHGLLYYVGGDAASQLQFFVTDTVSHFLRGTLNFRTQPNADSLAPVVRFVSQDIAGMLESLRWTE